MIVIDDINEFMDYFNSVSDLNAFVMKSIQRNIQIFALIRRPFSLTSTLMDQFHRKLIFSRINDAEAMSLFHQRRENARVELESQAYTIMEEKIVVVQMGTLNPQQKMKRQLQTVDYLPDRLISSNEAGLIGVCVRTLEIVYLQDNKQFIVTGTQESRIKEYCKLMKLECEIRPTQTRSRSAFWSCRAPRALPPPESVSWASSSRSKETAAAGSCGRATATTTRRAANGWFRSTWIRASGMWM